MKLLTVKWNGMFMDSFPSFRMKNLEQYLEYIIDWLTIVNVLFLSVLISVIFIRVLYGMGLVFLNEAYYVLNIVTLF